VDPIGWCIANLHQLLGHDKAAAVLGVPVGDKRHCIICHYEHFATPENKQAVIEALTPREG